MILRSAAIFGQRGLCFAELLLLHEEGKHPMRLAHLYYIVEIGKTHSISQAATNLFVTQPTLSIAIAALEKELGVMLFERTKTGVYPTSEGQKVIDLSEEVLNKLETIRTIGTPERRNVLQILTIPAVNCSLLQNAIIHFHQQYPAVQSCIHEEKPPIMIDTFVERIKESPTWFGICTLSDENKPWRETQFHKLQIAYEYLASDEMVCIVSADHPLAQADHVTTDQCRTLPKIKYQYSPSRQLTTSEDSRKKPIKSDSIFESLYDEGTVLTVSTLESLKRLIAEDAGVTIMPSVIVAEDPYLREGKIKALPFSDVQMPLHYYILYSVQVPLSSIEQDFITQIKLAFQNCPILKKR